MKRSALLAGLVLLALAVGGCASSEETTAASHSSVARPTISKGHAEAVFHRAVDEVAKGGAVKVGRLDTVETTCEPEKGQWGCTGWFVVVTSEYCVSVSATVTNAGRVGKESYGKLAVGEPGGAECQA
jgi:hypothetical protein